MKFKKSLFLTIFTVLILFVPLNLIASDNFYKLVPYKGAFGSTNWAGGWTALSEYGFLKETTVGSGSVITVTDADIAPGATVYWTADNTYVLEGFVFVDDGAVLNIEAGTVIKGKPGQGESASALIIARGGKIYAEGTTKKPIIFTAESDDVTDPYDIPFPTTNLWGGVIILGKATINLAAGQGQIEGIDPTDPRGLYGGNDDDDNSGIFRYVSIRHGGTDIGEGNEINGLTMGGVGLGTTIEYVEVFNNNDDGFEWFGGTVNCRYLISAFNVDDAFDHDEGYRGKQQFLFAIQAEDYGNRCGEHDGGREPVDGLPYAHPVVYNATYLGSGMNSTNPENDHLFKIRDNWGGEYYNSIFGDYAGDAMDVEDLDSGHDSRERLETGDIVFNNNIWFDFGVGSIWDVLGKHEWETTYFSDAANANEIINPQLNISRTANSSLDPRPLKDGSAYQNLANISMMVGNFCSSTVLPGDFTLSQNYPNPFNPTTNIEFTLLEKTNVELTVYNLIGQKVATLVNDNLSAGIHKAQWNASKLPSGIYIYLLKTGSTVLSKKLTLVK